MLAGFPYELCPYARLPYALVVPYLTCPLLASLVFQLIVMDVSVSFMIATFEKRVPVVGCVVGVGDVDVAVGVVDVVVVGVVVVGIVEGVVVAEVDVAVWGVEGDGERRGIGEVVRGVDVVEGVGERTGTVVDVVRAATHAPAEQICPPDAQS